MSTASDGLWSTRDSVAKVPNKKCSVLKLFMLSAQVDRLSTQDL